MSSEASASALAILTAGFGKELPKPTIRIYLNAMADLSPEVLARACDEIIKTSKFFPTVAEIREVTMRLDERIALPQAWDEAWEEVMTKIQREGRRRETEWSNEAIPEALKALGGYQRVCDATSIGAVEARFKNAYQRTATGERRRILLGGNNEESNGDIHISDHSADVRELGAG